MEVKTSAVYEHLADAMHINSWDLAHLVSTCSAMLALCAYAYFSNTLKTPNVLLRRSCFIGIMAIMVFPFPIKGLIMLSGLIAVETMRKTINSHFLMSVLRTAEGAVDETQKSKAVDHAIAPTSQQCEREPNTCPLIEAAASPPKLAVTQAENNTLKCDPKPKGPKPRGPKPDGHRKPKEAAEVSLASSVIDDAQDLVDANLLRFQQSDGTTVYDSKISMICMIPSSAGQWSHHVLTAPEGSRDALIKLWSELPLESINATKMSSMGLSAALATKCLEK